MSSFDPRKCVAAPDFAFDTELELIADQTVTIVGEYDVLVLNGIATVYGAVLRPNSDRKRIYAPSTQALPQIQARQNGTKVRICTVFPTVQKLERLSPLFRNIWAGGGQSYKILRSSEDDSLQRSLNPLEIDKDMDAVLRTLSAKVMVEPRKPRIMAVGAKSSGKSTFNRVLCNHIQSWTPTAKCQYLDLDPGQPEFGPPGQVSLVEVAMPLLGPSFTHLAQKNFALLRLVRSHTIAATSFKHDPEHYRECALDLCKRVNTDLPLVVNACGWVNGLGASILTELTALLRISDLVLLEPLDSDFTEPLQSTNSGVAIYKIPRQPPKPSSRTPAEQRAMQTMAYFHHRQRATEAPRFSGKTLSEARPYIVDYAGMEQSIIAVASYGQAPKAEFLSEVLNGAIVAIVVLESGYQTTLEGHVGRTYDNVPYLLPNADGTNRTLEPQHSCCVGLAFVRGIDADSSSLHLVSPLNEDDMAHLAEREVVLVRGGFDAPDWVYLEDLYCDDAGDADTDGRPWVSKREMVGIEGAVWRLRHPPMASSITSSR